MQLDRARAYLALQALAGAAWWIAVFTSDDVRRWTLGDWDPGVLVGPDLVLFCGASALAAWRGERRAAVVAAVWTGALTLAVGAYGLVEQEAGWGVVAMTVAAVGSALAALTLWSGQLSLGWLFVGPFSFRVARERTPAGQLRRSLVQLAVFWSVFFLLLPLVAAAVERRLRLGWPALEADRWDAVGAVVFALASVLGVWSCVTMALRGDGTPLPADTARHLVIAGPYRFVRNPMAVAGALQTVGVGLWHGSWIVIAAAAAGAVAWDQVIRPEEEADLLARFGPPFAAYRSQVFCWIPTRPGVR